MVNNREIFKDLICNIEVGKKYVLKKAYSEHVRTGADYHVFKCLKVIKTKTIVEQHILGSEPPISESKEVPTGIKMLNRTLIVCYLLFH